MKRTLHVMMVVALAGLVLAGFLSACAPPAAPPPPAELNLARYPAMEAPEEVVIGQPFAVELSLTEEQVTPETGIEEGQATPEDKLNLRLPDQGKDRWPIDVILSAPGFGFDSRNDAQITLPRQGDSTPARFRLKAKAGGAVNGERRITATLWHLGAYLARIGRTLRVVGAALRSRAEDRAALPERVEGVQRIALDLSLQPPDLTIFVLPMDGAAGTERAQLLIESPYLQPSVHEFGLPRDLLEKWLASHYADFVRDSPRGVQRADEGEAMRQEGRKARLRGFGSELYQKFAPLPFKEAFWRVMDQLGHRFRSIQIFTDDPLLPWELMRPVRSDGTDEQDFLGMRFRIARWHVGRGTSQLDRPPQTIVLRELAVISPQYQPPLLAQAREIQGLRSLPGFREVPGRFTAIKGLFASLPQGIIHFAGHGVMRDTGFGFAEYGIVLEDGLLDLTSWRGLLGGPPAYHPFIFFNACEVGQAQRVANFVHGWAPAVLEAGASGYVGGLWPLSDQGAAAFAVRFYENLGRRLPEGGAYVSELLRDTRGLFYSNGDPTFLAYVFYGDPNLSITAQRFGP